VRLDPTERARLSGLCPQCGKPVTVGVLSRIEALADRPEGNEYRPPRARPYDSLVPLTEVLADVLGRTAASDAVQRLYFRLLDQVGPELYVLRQATVEELRRVADPLLGEALLRMRRGELRIAPGFDGEYGRIALVDRRRARWQGSHSADGLVRMTMTEPPDQPWLFGLSPTQRQVATWVDGPQLVTAGPGSGKTRTLCAWIVELLRAAQVAPEDILAVTFTRRAARELQ
jgi:DNA helicase-2/ATP-dependent DNA helicase PcrA